MKLFLFEIFFSSITLAYAVKEFGESSSHPTDPNQEASSSSTDFYQELSDILDLNEESLSPKEIDQELSKYLDFNEESSSNSTDIDQNLIKLQDSDCSCRLGSSKRIINGEIAEPHLVPWQVSLANSTGYHFCGAIIINHYYVLTSAKCIRDKIPEEIKVRVGLHNINDPIPSEKIYDVELIDGFNFDRKYGGMAMLKLKHFIEFITGEVEPACLDLVKGEILRILMVSGWGHTSPKIENPETNLVTFGKLSPVLKIGYLYEIRKACSSYYICSKSLNGDSPYIADNGGPLHYTQEGLSMVEGMFLGLRSELGTIKITQKGNIIFSRFSFYKKWIVEKIGEDYCTKDGISNSESKRKIESSPNSIALNKDSIELQDFNEESSSNSTDFDQDLIKLQDSDCSCRLGSSKRIINGEIAEPHLVPWQVSLANSTGYHFCGAIIINHYYVLTSAKCIRDKSKEEIKVRVGLHNINDPIPSENIYDVKLIDGFNFDRKYGGMAILKLKHYIKFIPGVVEPACLNLIKGEILRKLMVSGWGHTTPKIENPETNLVTFGKLSPVLKIGYLNEIRKSCSSYYICSNSLNGDSPYIADNGGPLHYTREGLTTVEGVFLDLRSEPGTIKITQIGNIIFSRFSFYKKWIVEKIGEDYCTKDGISNSESKRKIESSSISIGLNKDSIELQDSNAESLSSSTDFYQELSDIIDLNEESLSPIEIDQELIKLQDSDCSCRLGSSRRIINGEIAEPHLVPWQVSLANLTGYHFCGAIIINHYNILTSGKCLKDKSEEEIKVRVGLHNINDQIPIEKIYDVELIDGSNFDRKYGGMAILKLKHYIKFVPGVVEPACLNLIKGEILTKPMVSGWGHTSPKIENTETNLVTFGTLSPVLKIGYLNEVGHNINERYIFTSSLYGDSPCIADNGGPLHSTRDGITMVEGVLLDFLDLSGTIKHYFNGNSVFARLSFYKEWIITKTSEDYCNKDRLLKSEIESSSRPIDPNQESLSSSTDFGQELSKFLDFNEESLSPKEIDQELSKYLEFNEESSSPTIKIDQDLIKLQDSDCSCRLGSSKRIINGEIAEPHLVPWQVSLANSTGYHFCGAIIINHYYVLTSANCLKHKKKEEIKIRVGIHNINDPIPNEKTYDVELIDGFNFKGTYGGMAMLKLKHFIEFITGEVEPACLDLVKGEILRILMVSGWGHTSPKIENPETNLVTFGKLSPVLKIGYLYETRHSCHPFHICSKSLNGDSPYIADNGGPLHYTRGGLTMVEGMFLGLRAEPETIKITQKGNIIFSRFSFYKQWFVEKISEDYCTEDRVLKSGKKRKIESYDSFDDPKGKKKLRFD